MQVNLDKIYAFETSTELVWTFFQDIPAVAVCMPGAIITEKVDESNYKGTVKVKIGPATANFKGDIEVKEMDAEKKQVRMVGKGGDVKGTSNATMDLTAHLRDTEDGCELVGYAEVSVTGKMASMGGRMMNQIADQILNQFGDNLKIQVAALGEGEGARAAKEKATEQAAKQSEGINVFSFIWQLLVNLVRKLFGGKSS